jgi:hypothetical protein
MQTGIDARIERNHQIDRSLRRDVPPTVIRARACARVKLERILARAINVRLGWDALFCNETSQ